MNESLTFPIRSDKLSMTVRVIEHLYHERSTFQTIDIYETEALGRMLFLDGHVQLATFDEFAYHEALVHIPLSNILAPRRALVIGGGDGGVLRELTKHTSLEHIDLVDIDSSVIEASKRFLPELSDGAFADPRVHVHIDDAFEFVKQIRAPYDLIVMDVTDVYEEEDGELSERLWTEAFFADCQRILAPAGFVVSQADNHVFCPYSMTDVLDQFGRVFDETGSFQAIVPSFGGFSGYVWASNGAQVAEEPPSRLSEIPGLRYINPTTYVLGIQGGKPGGIFA